MSSNTETLVVKELQELKQLESQLQAKWRQLKGAGSKVRSSFVSSLEELEAKAQRLEHLLDDSAAGRSAH